MAASCARTTGPMAAPVFVCAAVDRAGCGGLMRAGIAVPSKAVVPGRRSSAPRALHPRTRNPFLIVIGQQWIPGPRPRSAGADRGCIPE
jgi:hypothetical protein